MVPPDRAREVLLRNAVRRGETGSDEPVRRSELRLQGDVMSMVNRAGNKIVLTRVGGPEELWREVRDHYAGADAKKWKYLAMLALKVNAGWSLEMIGNAFGHERGHICRSLSVLCREMQDRFEWLADAESDEDANF